MFDPGNRLIQKPSALICAIAKPEKERGAGSRKDA
jgi:hypothetical protein